MLKHPEQTSARIERFIQREIVPALWTRQAPMRVFALAGDQTVPPEMAPEGQWLQVETGFRWGPVYTDQWFRLEGVTPADWAGQCVVARVDCGAEAIVWDGGNPVQGIDVNHRERLITAEARGGEVVCLHVRANGMNPCVSCDAEPVAPPAFPFALGECTLACYDAELWGLYHDLRVAFEVMRELSTDSPRRGRLLYALNAAVNAWDPSDRSTLGACQELVASTYARRASASAHRLSAVGHAHIDTAWLWPVERSKQKCLHTFSTAIELMDQYPEYHFVCSQAQQYAWIKELAPDLYERIRARVARGQWEIVGSMWVEADCNVSGGESLVRQILYGKRYWMKEFGYETRDLWLPDVFGYAASLPQILRKSGIDYFLTQKISWNQTNKFPHHTFYWQGIDGSQVFTHFPPADTYNAAMTPRELAYNSRNFRDHDRADRSLYVFGHGDGGGGPTAEMLENARRLRDVEGMPTVTMDSVLAFFAAAEAEGRDVPVWVGELYLELHRGTLTSQSRCKRGNRKCEFALRDAEYLCATSPEGLGAYPSAAIERLWKTVLLNQFHDIIPGSSVREVYIDAESDYSAVLAGATTIIETAVASLAGAIDTRGMRHPVLVVRNNDHRIYGQPVTAPLADGFTPASVTYGHSESTPVQIVVEEGQRMALFQEQTTEEGHGYTVYDLSEASCPEVNTFTVTERVLDNALVRVEFDDHGLITRIYDRLMNREIVPAGAVANALQLFDDRPLYWDAWDVDVFFSEKGRVLGELDSIEVLESGPVRGAVRLVRRFGDSCLTQTIRLARDRTLIEFVTEVDWRESHRMLKVAFPVDINASRATFEIQYGSVERPTHRNTSWDQARFEVAAQKWVDISEGGYGVALINDCKYGHDVVGNTLRLTLLRSPKAPDPEADMGRHVFTYGLMPHYADYRRGGVVEQAYRLNAPPRAYLLPPDRAGKLASEQVYLTIDREGVIIEAVKKAEDEEAVIVRLYDAHNMRGTVRLQTSIPCRSATLCDLLERDIAPLQMLDGAVVIPLRPFEIVTVKLR